MTARTALAGIFLFGISLSQTGCDCWFFCFEHDDAGWLTARDAWSGERNIERECGSNYVDEECYWRVEGCYLDPNRCAWVRRPGPYDGSAGGDGDTRDARSRDAPRSDARRDAQIVDAATDAPDSGGAVPDGATADVASD